MTGPRIVSLEPMDLGDVFEDIRTVAGALGRPERAERLNADLAARLDAIRERTRQLANRPLVACIEWIDPLLSAVRNGRVYLTDGNQYFNRPGPRVVESAEILAELLHPEVFDFGHRGSGWTEWVG